MKKKLLAVVLTIGILMSLTIPFTLAAENEKSTQEDALSGETPVLADDDPYVTEVDGAFFSKQLVKDDSDNLAIQIEAWTEGVVSVVPTEIVMLVDLSGSMYQTGVGTSNWMKPSAFVKTTPVDPADPTMAERAAVAGYYVALVNNPSGKDVNGASNIGGDCAVYLIRWNETSGYWERTSQFSYTGYGKGCYDTLDFSAVFSKMPTMQWVQLKNENKTKDGNTKIFKTLLGATIDGYYALLDEVKDIPNAKIAVASFASPKGMTDSGDDDYVGGTGAFFPNADQSAMEFVRTRNLSEKDMNSAFVSVENDDLIRDAITKLSSHYSNTCTQEGFLVVNDIFKASDEARANAGESGKQVQRMVVLFTDGAPTCNTNSIGYDSSAKGKEYAVQAAYETKNTYGATVFALGNSYMQNNHGSFVNYLSSNYPVANFDGTSYSGIADSDKTSSETDYVMFADNADQLKENFKDIGTKIFKESNALNQQTEIRDTVTPYFDIGGGYNGGKIVVEKIPYGANGFDDSLKETLYDKDNGIELVTLVRNNDVEYDQPLSDGSVEKRTGDQIVVKGYDYVANTVFPNEGRGAKLRLLIPIEPNDYFIGGSWAVTNSEDSGIFPNVPGTEGDGALGGGFAPPHTDVDVKEDQVVEAEVDARAGSTYLEQVAYSELLPLVTLSVKGIDTLLQMGVPNYGLEPWQTDYVFIETHLYDSLVDEEGNLVDENGNLLGEDDEPVKDPTKELKEGDLLEVRRNHAVVVEVYIWSRYTYVDGEPVLQKERPADLEPSTGIIYLTVYYPTFVFRDRTLYYGEPLTEVTKVWGKEMDATPYLKWYTNDEYDLLTNPKATAGGYTPLVPEESIGKDEGVIVDKETPKVYFIVDPIDSMVPDEEKTGSVDTIFYEKYGNYMLKQRIEMNVQVYFENENDSAYDPNNPPEDNKMRNAFFLHVTCDSPETCSHEECKLQKHTSGSKNTLHNYWTEEFYILPETCELTIKKTGGIPGETYVFHISTDAQLVTNPDMDPDLTNAPMVHYNSVSITVDEKGNGSVTVYELPIGTYQVTEDDEWSWRFGVPEVKWGYGSIADKDGAVVELKPNAAEDHATVAFKNPTPVEEWLNGLSAVVRNVFGEAKEEE